MKNDKYQSQRLQGAREIIDTVNTFAKEKGFSLDSCVWDEGQEIVERLMHTLTITVGSKLSRGKFPDEWLADYPGKVGTEKTDALLMQMISGLV